MKNNIDQAPGAVDEEQYGGPDESGIIDMGQYLQPGLTSPGGFNGGGIIFSPVAQIAWGNPASNPLQDLRNLWTKFFGQGSEVVSSANHLHHIHMQLKEWKEEANGTTTAPAQQIKGGRVLPERKFNHGPKEDPHAKRGKRK